MEQSDFTSVDGQLNGSIEPNDRGLIYGDGVFETMLVVNGVVPFWDYHQRRLLHGLGVLGINQPTSILNLMLQQLSIYLDKSPSEKRNGVAKLIVTRGKSSRGYSIDDSASPTAILSYQPTQPFTVRESAKKITCCDTRVFENKTLAGLKHLCRLENVLAQREIDKTQFDDGLLLSHNDLIIEALSSNVFFVKNDQIYTPRLNSAGVKGVIRSFILEELAGQCAINIIETDIHRSELAQFSESFMSNGVVGLVEIESIDQVQFQVSGNIFGQLQQKVLQQMHRKHSFPRFPV